MAWNLKKIYKYSRDVFEADHGAILVEDETGEKRLDVLQGMYREFGFPSNVKALRKWLRSPRERRKIFMGIDYNEETFVKEEVVPKLSDVEYLQSLPPNTVGGHLGNLFKNWSIEELYEKRYLEVEEDEESFIQGSFATELRANISRHLFLWHDMFHILFRYDTSIFGEALVQKVTCKAVPSWAPTYVAFMVTLKVAWRTKSLMPFKAFKEAGRLGEAADKKDLICRSPLSLLERDIEEVRKEFNIGMPVEFLKWSKKHPDIFRGDCIHPKYEEDIIWQKAESI